MMRMMMGAVCVFVTLGVLARAQEGKHSLFYIYTSLSRNLSLSGIHQFSALGFLDDRLIDYYDGDTKEKVPKQTWMKEKMEDDYWKKGTDSRRSKEQWFKVNLDILMERMRHNQSDLHVLQWTHGCEVDEDTSGNVKFLSGVDMYSYDGADFLSFDEVHSRWIAPVPAAEPTKKKWDDVPILNQYTKGYLEKECVDWLKKFMEYGKEELKKHSPPEVHIFTKESVSDPNNLILSCLATGFFPPDATMQLRKSKTPLPEYLVTSSGIVPNGDGTYQMRSHTTIVKDTTAVYDCYVTHLTSVNPIIKEWGFKEDSGITGILIAVVAVVLLLTGLIIIILVVLKIKGKICAPTGDSGTPSPGSSRETIKLSDDSSVDSSNSSLEKSPENTQPMLANSGGGVEEA